MWLAVCFVNQCANSCQEAALKETVEAKSYGNRLFVGKFREVLGKPTYNVVLPQLWVDGLVY
jgi:hypothetical protein